MSYNERTRALMRRMVPNMRADKIPPETSGTWMIDGVMIHVMPSAHARATGRVLRVIAWCPCCGKRVAESRLPQHMRVHQFGPAKTDWRMWDQLPRRVRKARQLAHNGVKKS